MHPRSFILCLLVTLGLRSAPVFGDSSYEFTYGGRLTDPEFKPVKGPVALNVTFYHDNKGQTPILSVSDGLQSVSLQQGIFQFTLTLLASEYDKVFSDVSQGVWIQITDLTNRPNDPYPLQQVELAPYAAKVPVDGATVSFNGEGKLTVGPSGAPGANQFLTKDRGGNLIWGTPATSASALQGQALSTAVPAAGQVLQYNGTQWLPATVTQTAAGLSSLSVTAPLASSGSAAAPALSITQATSVSAGYLAASDWISFNGKLSSSGGSMSGALDMGGAALTDLPAPVNAADAATKAYVDAVTAGGGVATTTFGTGDHSATPGAGLLRGPAAAGTNVAGASVTLTAGNGTGTGGSGALLFQTASAAASGSTADTLATRLAITAAGNIGLGTTLPGSLLDVNGAFTQRGMAAPALSAAGQGVLYFDSGSGQFKLSQNGGAYAPLATGGSVTGVSSGNGLTGGTITTTGTLSLATLGTPGSYAKVVTDAYGRVTGGTTLTVSDIPALAATAITSGTFNLAQVPSLPASLLSSGSVNLAQIPALPASQITSGTLTTALIPPLPATQLTSGTVNLAQIPGLPAAQITSGTLALATVPSLPAAAITSGSFSVSQIPASIVTSGTFNTAQLPSHSAALITSVTLSTAVLPSLSGSYVALTGSTMSGALNLPLNGLVAGSNQLVLANGNVGIGTTAPASLLHIANAGSLVFEMDSGSTSRQNQISFQRGSATTVLGPSSSNQFDIYSQENIPITFQNNSTERMRIAANGNVGVGTTSPAGILDIAYSSGTAHGLVVSSTGNVGIQTASPTAGYALTVNGQSYTQGMNYSNYFTAATGNQTPALQGAYMMWNLARNGLIGETDFVNNLGGGLGGFAFYNANASGSITTPALVIQANGNVGVGTTSPAAPLEVYGTDTTMRIHNRNDLVGAELQETFSSLQFGLSNTTGTVSGIVPANTTRMLFGIGNTGKVGSLTNNDFNNAVFRNVLDDGNGNVGIGTTAPTAKLAVAGTAGTDGIQFPDGTLQTTASTTNTNSSTLSGGYTLGGSSGVYQDTGLSVTLPSSGTYLVRGNIRGAITVNSTSSCQITAELYNTTDGAAVANSARQVLVVGGSPSGTYMQATAPLDAIITVTAAKAIHVYEFWSGAACASELMYSDTNGYTTLSYIKLSN